MPSIGLLGKSRKLAIRKIVPMDAKYFLSNKRILLKYGLRFFLKREYRKKKKKKNRAKRDSFGSMGGEGRRGKAFKMGLYILFSSPPFLFSLSL